MGIQSLFYLDDKENIDVLYVNIENVKTNLNDFVCSKSYEQKKNY